MLDMTRIQKFISKGNSEKALSIAAETSLSLKDAVSKFSEVSKILYPVVFNREGLEAAIQDIVDRYNKQERIQFNLDYQLSPSEDQLTQLVIYRVFQELTTNANKHSQASQVTITLKENSESILMSYQDDGIGFDLNAKSNGLGLNSIRGRIEAINGTVQYKTKKGQGLNVNINIPLDEKNSHS